MYKIIYCRYYLIYILTILFQDCFMISSSHEHLNSLAVQKHRVQYIKMKAMIHISAITIICLLITASSGQQNSNVTIYGIRWFLGDHFTFTNSDSTDNNEYFVLSFNSDYPLNGQLSAMIGKNRFSCTSDYMSTEEVTPHHPELTNFTNEVDNDTVDTTYLHKCIIGNLRAIVNNQNIKTVSYSITLDNLYITQSANPTIDKFSHLFLFNGTFRLPYYETSFQALVIGDWGELRKEGQQKGYIDPFPCLLKKLQKNENIVMVIFTGDIAYDLQGGKYYSMLKFMQPLTSKVTLIVTPGNHDTLYHADTFELFTKTYYTPQWWTYSNYFNQFSIGKLLFVFYNPELEEFDFTHPDRLKKNLTTIFENEFPPDVISTIRASYFPIVVSHYPIYCSNINDDYQSCEKNVDRFKKYREYFAKMDMKLYISGHLHVYERTSPICPNGSFIAARPDDYNMSCPVYIVEGAGGNDFYVQTKQEYPPKDFSSSIVFNTGFGILTINSASEYSYPDSVSYEHISATNCSAADHFKMTNTVYNTNINTNNSSSSYHFFVKILIKSAIVCFLFAAVFFLLLFIKRRYQRSKNLIKTNQQINQNNHVEMVQENFDAPQSDKPQNITE